MMREPILIVDDEEDLRTVLGDALRRDGYLVESADSVASALALMETTHYPVIITDLNLPGGPSGFELIAAAKVRDPLALCIVITGFASTETAILAIKHGAYDFVKKPFRLAEMEAAVDRALDHGRILKELEGYRQDLEGRVLARMKDLQTFHEEVACLNDLLVSHLGEPDEAAFLAPFLDWLDRRFHADGLAVLLPKGQGWSLLLSRGARPWPGGASLPAPAELTEPVEWTDGHPHGFLMPLRRGKECLGALFLGFEDRLAFSPEDRAFQLWRRQVEAGLHGADCLRRAQGLPGRGGP